MTERALVETSKRTPEKGTQLFLDALSAADMAMRCSLLRVLGRLGGKKALQVVTADTKSADATVKDAAVRALAEWPDASAATELLNIARSTETLAHHVLALRGCVRLVVSAAGGSERPPQEKTRFYKDAMSAARRPEDKTLVIARLANERSLEALNVVADHLGDEALRAEAALAVVKLACPPDAKTPGLRGADVSRALRKALDALPDPALREQVKKYLVSITADEMNVALNKPVKTSVGHQGHYRPELAVDGKKDIGSAWWGPTTPSWLQVDLGQPTSINAAHVTFYWDGKRYYQYRLDVSLDEKEWKTVADASQTTALSTPEGFAHQFAPAQARYVRIHVLKNSLNPGAHIVELRVFACEDQK